MNRKKKESISNAMATIVAILLFFAGLVFTIKSLLVIIPLIIIYICIRYYKVRKNNKVRSEGLSSAVFSLIVIAIVLVFLGHLMRGCAYHKHDPQKQRIEMGLPLY